MGTRQNESNRAHAGVGARPRTRSRRILLVLTLVTGVLAVLRGVELTVWPTREIEISAHNGALSLDYVCEGGVLADEAGWRWDSERYSVWRWRPEVRIRGSHLSELLNPFVHHPPRLYGSRLYIVLPFWIPFALLSLVTGLIWWRVRGPAGRCRNCNYDLTGNTSGVCPECGTPVQEHEAAGNESVPTKEED